MSGPGPLTPQPSPPHPSTTRQATHASTPLRTSGGGPLTPDIDSDNLDDDDDDDGGEDDVVMGGGGGRVDSDLEMGDVQDEEYHPTSTSSNSTLSRSLRSSHAQAQGSRSFGRQEASSASWGRSVGGTSGSSRRTGGVGGRKTAGGPREMGGKDGGEGQVKLLDEGYQGKLLFDPFLDQDNVGATASSSSEVEVAPAAAPPTTTEDAPAAAPVTAAA